MFLTEYLKNHCGRWAWLGQRAHDALGINELIPLDLIICCDYGKDIPLFYNRNLISIEKNNSYRMSWTNEDLNKNFHCDNKSFLNILDEFSTPLNIICYRSIKEIEKLSREKPDKLKVYSCNESLKNYFDNKILLRRKLSSLGIEPIPGKIVYLNENIFKSLKQEFGLPFIVQFPYGSSGLYTYKIKNSKDFKNLCLIYNNPEVNILKYINGFTVNTNAVVTSNKDGIKIYFTYPSIQLTGIKECSNSETSFCGNDFTCSAVNLDGGILKQINNFIIQIGKWMAKKGYRGIFGLDIIVEYNSKKAYVLEINPRFQNSTSLLTLSDLNSNKKFPLVLVHLFEFLKKYNNIKTYNFDGQIYENQLNAPAKGSQIILHNSLAYSKFRGDIVPGAYKFIKNELVYVKKTASLLDCKDDDILITCGVPFKGQLLYPGSNLCKIQTWQSVVDSDFKNLNAKFKKIIKKVYKKFDLTKEIQINYKTKK